MAVAALLLGYNGSIEDGEKVLASARQFGKPLADMVAPMPYGARQTMLDAPNAEHGLHRYWRSAFTDRISDGLIDELIDELVAAAAKFSSPLSALIFFYMHGAGTRVPVSNTAFSARRPQWDFDAIGHWVDGAQSETHIGWLRSIWSRVEPHLQGRSTSTTLPPMIFLRKCELPSGKIINGYASLRRSLIQRTSSG